MGRGPEEGAAEVHVDARGTRCPVPVLRLAAAVRGLPPGTTASVEAEDPAVEHDVPAWAGMRGHEVLRVEQTGGVWLVVVRTGGAWTGAGGTGGVRTDGRSSAAADAAPARPPATGSAPG